MIDLESILKDYESKGYHLKNPREVKSGKEATVFVVQSDDKSLALKVYRNPEHRSFRDNLAYLEGRYFRKSSERKAVLKNSRFGRGMLHKKWVSREYYLLGKLFNLGADVPKVYDCNSESILMEFIGDNLVAPRLIDVELDKNQASATFRSILNDIKLFLDVGIVHSDLSAYNILWWNQKPFIIDLPQAIDIRQNPNREILLKRDLDNLISYFSRFTPIDKESIYKEFDLAIYLIAD
jgi:RIO kinase 1